MSMLSPSRCLHLESPKFWIFRVWPKDLTQALSLVKCSSYLICSSHLNIIFTKNYKKNPRQFANTQRFYPNLSLNPAVFIESSSFTGGKRIQAPPAATIFTGIATSSTRGEGSLKLTLSGKKPQDHPGETVRKSSDGFVTLRVSSYNFD